MIIMPFHIIPAVPFQRSAESAMDQAAENAVIFMLNAFYHGCREMSLRTGQAVRV